MPGHKRLYSLTLSWWNIMLFILINLGYLLQITGFIWSNWEYYPFKCILWFCRKWLSNSAISIALPCLTENQLLIWLLVFHNLLYSHCCKVSIFPCPLVCLKNAHRHIVQNCFSIDGSHTSKRLTYQIWCKWFSTLMILSSWICWWYLI